MSLNIRTNINNIRSRIEFAYKNSNRSSIYPKIVAVSKLKPIDYIIEAYNCGIHCFGENYIQELESKSNDEKLITTCPNIKWHYIGKIQSKNINKLLKIQNLEVIQTLSSSDFARSIDEKLNKFKRENKLEVMVQVNTSGESMKNGLQPNDVEELVSFIIENCHNLKFTGLMTIGSLENSLDKDINKDFVTLVKCREQLCSKLNLTLEDVDLSMGMSCDFEQAIAMGSTVVRIGSEIFGERTVTNQ